MKGEMLGTGFVASYQKHHIVVTCAHVLRQGGYASGSTVKVIPFDPRCDGLSCKVVIVGPDTGDPLNFSALQDTALMKFTSSSSSSISPLLLTATSYARHKNCSFFGYGVEKGSKGDWRAGINCEGPVGKGFHKLTNTGEQPLCHGNSGSPLRARLGRIVGMVHSSQGPKNIFLIPSSAIVQVIKQYFQT